MKLRRLTRKTCPRTGGEWFAALRKPWGWRELTADDYDRNAPAAKARHRKDPERLALKARVLRAAGHRCESCRSPARLTVDHIVPRFLGGGNHYENLQCLCEACNQAKGLNIWAPEYRRAA